MHDCEELFTDGTMEEVYKIQRQSSVDKQHIIANETYTWYMYRPYCHGNLPVFTIGCNGQTNPAAVDDIIAVMTGGVIEGPVEGTNITLGDTVYAAWDGTNPYLTTDENDSDIECCWGIIVDDQRPIHYGGVRPAAAPPWHQDEDTAYQDLYSVKMIQPACGSIEGRLQ